MFKRFLIFTLIFIQHFAFAQNEDSLTQAKSDTSKSIIVKKRTPKSPLKASLLSAVVPGSGQIYNQKYWKAPIVWGGFGVAYYFYDVAKTRYDFYHQMLIYKDQNADDATQLAYIKQNSSEVTNLSAENLLAENKAFYQSRNDTYRENIQQVYLGTFVWYLLNVVDASVDAHFSTFDVSDDLSVRLSPTVVPNNFSFQSGIRCTLNF